MAKTSSHRKTNKRVMKKIIIPILLSISSQLMIAQTSLTLQQCREQAIEYNKELKKAELRKKEVYEQQKAARTAYLPSVEFSTNLIYSPNFDKIELPGGFLPTAESAAAGAAGDYSGISNVWSPGMSIDLGDLTILYGGLSVNQAIYAGGKIRNINKKADAGAEMAEMAVTLKHADIIELTDKMFWNLATVEANKKVAEKYIEMLTDLEERLTLMYDTGLIPASEKLKVTVQKNDAQLQLLKADNGIKVLKMYLNHILGQDLSTDISISYNQQDVVLTSKANGETLALANRNELKILEKQLELTKLDKKITQADYLPQLGIGLQYSGFYVNNITDDPKFRPMLAAKLTIPIFSWRQGKHKRNAADYKIEQAQLELSNTNDLISLEVKQVEIQLEEAYEAIQIAHKNIAQTEESLDETEASFKVGLNSTSDLLSAQAQWLKAKTQLMSAYADYKLLETKLEKVTGLL